MSAGSHDGGRSRKRANSRRSIAARRRAAQRRSEIIRLAMIRRQNSVSVDFSHFAYALASAIGSGTPGRYPVGSAGQWRTAPGLDVMSLADAMRAAGFRGLDLKGDDGDRLANAIEDFHALADDPRHSGLSGAVLGRLLHLTAEERTHCDIRSLEATDETVADRRARARAGKLERDRERQRARRAGTSKPHAASAEHRKPWEAEGISRSTFYKRRSNGPPAPPEVATSATNQSEGNSNKVVSRATKQSRDHHAATTACRTDLSRTHEIISSGDETVRTVGRVDHLSGVAAAGASPAAPLPVDRRLR